MKNAWVLILQLEIEDSNILHLTRASNFSGGGQNILDNQGQYIPAAALVPHVNRSSAIP